MIPQLAASDPLLSYCSSLLLFIMGLFTTVVDLIRSNLILISGLIVVSYFASNYFNHGLQRYPGPSFAKFTDLWRLLEVRRRRSEVTHLALHKRYGDVVRLGPNVLSFADPKAVKDIYGLNKGYVKSGFYPVQQSTFRGQRLPSLFSTTDESYHAQLRRSVNSAFSMSALVQYEPAVNTVTEQFLQRTEELFVHANRTCDFAEWLQYFAFDAIGKITYSTPHGFLERNEDVDGIIAFLRKLFDYVAPVGQMPFLDLLLMKNPLLPVLERYGILSATFPVVTFARARMAERMAETEKDDEEMQGTAKPDLLSKFLKAKADRPDFFDDSKVLIMAVSMAFAGSETTAITLAAVFYFLLKHPDKYAKLMQELDDAVQSEQVQIHGKGLVSWKDAQTLPYLDAVVQESFRLHPAPGLPMERVTPPQGVEISGHKIPGGTIVGCSAWVIHRRPEIFGADVDTFRPERWLEASPATRKTMEGTMLQFGAGARTCIGKNISLLEVYKLVPSFLLRFKVSLADPSKEWTPHNAWFVRQKDFHVRFELRGDQSPVASDKQ